MDPDLLIRLCAGGAAVWVLVALLLASAIARHGLDDTLLFLSSVVVLGGFGAAIFGPAAVASALGVIVILVVSGFIAVAL